MNQRSQWVNRLAVLAIPLLALAMVALWVADLRLVWPLPPLHWLIHYGPVALGVAFIVIPAARSFLASGEPSVLMLGCGVLMMDVGVVAMPFAFAWSSDTAFAIYNTSVLLGALSHFAGVGITSRRKIRLKRSATWLTAVYAGGMAAVGLVIWAAFAGRMPVFFIDGQGGTLLRSVVVSTAVALFVLTAGLLWQTNRRTPSPFLYWYALGLVLLAVGLGGAIVIALTDSPLQWTARSTQVLATVYMCVAVLASARESRIKGIPLAAVEEAWRGRALMTGLRQQTPLGWVARYSVAVGAVAAGWGLRLALEAWVGPGLPTYVTFYPAVMAVALLAGFGPGLLATAIVGLTAAYCLLPPVGQFAIASPVDRLGLAIFIGMGAFMSVVAELYRRNRQKAAAYDREVVLRESQEALRRQAELIDPVRAGLIAEEMQRVVRERGGDATPSPEPAGETLRRVPAVTGWVVAATGMLVLLGWAIDVNALKSVLPGLATMKVNTALCFVLSGIALALRDRRAVRLTGAAVTTLVAALSLGEYVLGRDFGIDQLLFHDPGDPHTVPGRMAQATAVAFLFTGGALTLLTVRSRAGRWAQQVFAVGTSLIGLATLLGYAYQSQQLFALAGLSSVALPTAAAFVALGGGLVCARSDGLMSALVARGSGAQLAGRLLPAVLLVPIVLGWLHVVGEQTDIFTSPMGAALFALAMVVSLAALVFWSAGTLSRADAARRETEIQLRNQAEVMDHAHDALIVREMDGVIRSWNRGAERLYGWSAADAVGQSTDTLLHTPAGVVQEFETALEQTGHWEGELLHTTRDGRRITIEARMTASRAKDGRVLVLESNRDITQRKRAEEALRRSEGRWNAAIENFGEGAIIADEAEQVIYWNPAARRLHGFTSDTEGIGPLNETPLTFELRTPDGQHPLALDEWPMRRIKRGETVRNLELRLRRPDQGWEKIVSYSGAMVETAGGERLIFLSVYDLTELRQAEAALKASLDEKEVLLKEIHHRVKNNMQVISSLVDLQADQLQDDAMRAVLQDVTHRVRSMALVHEKLYQSADMARIEFAEYARSLLNYLWRAHGAAASSVRLAMDMEPVPLSVNAAVPCGLVLNELASNALRHAFRGRDNGEVAVSLRGSPEGRVCLRVRDNGVGLPAGLDWRRADSLGLRLVQMLAGQLDGTVEVCSNEGTEFVVSFGGPIG